MRFAGGGTAAAHKIMPALDSPRTDFHLVIEPGKRGVREELADLLHFRDLLYFLVRREITVRYKQTLLGAMWAVLQPFMAMVVFSIFFGRLAQMPSDGFPYPIFVYTALLPWIFFANAVSTSGNSLLGSASLVSKVYFPRLIIPLASVGAGVIDFGPRLRRRRSRPQPPHLRARADEELHV